MTLWVAFIGFEGYNSSFASTLGLGIAALTTSAPRGGSHSAIALSNRVMDGACDSMASTNMFFSGHVVGCVVWYRLSSGSGRAADIGVCYLVLMHSFRISYMLCRTTFVNASAFGLWLRKWPRLRLGRRTSPYNIVYTCCVLLVC